MIKIIVVRACACLMLAMTLSGPGNAAGPRPGQDPLDWCATNGGRHVEQPPGSNIRACCTAEGCVICDASWRNCAFDPAYRLNNGALDPGSGGGIGMGQTGRPGVNQGNPGVLVPLLNR